MNQNVKSIAIVLDISVRPSPKGKRVLDLVKKDLIEFVRTFDCEDLFYLYHPEVTEVLDNRGDQISAIGNYDTDGYSLQDMLYAFKQTYYVLSALDEGAKRTFCYITDRFNKSSVVHLKKLFNIPKTMGVLATPCEFLVIAVGDQQDLPALQEVCKDRAELVCISDGDNLLKALTNHYEEIVELTI